ncbi:MAG: hypothetical protein ACJATN_001009 [Neolewinella sp.]|jgi:hypothetical protein
MDSIIFGRGRRCNGSSLKSDAMTSNAPFKPSFAPAFAPKKAWLLLLLLCGFGSLLSAQAGALLREAQSATSKRQTEIVRELQALDRNAYDAEAESALRQLLATEALVNQEEYIMIAGFLGRADLLAVVPEIDRREKPIKRAISLAKVRAGDEERRDNLMKNLRRIDVNDEFVYAVVPLLVYTRDRAVFKYLWELVITENMTCTPADAETEGRIDCAYRIVEYLGTAIEGFPVKIDEDHNLITKDYAAALAEIRRWYAAHTKDYVITTNTY